LAAVVSPSGNWLAMTVGSKNARVALVVFDLQKWALHKVVARFSDVDIDDPEWVNDDTLLFSIADNTRGGSDQRWWPGLFAVSRDGGLVRQLVKTDGSRITVLSGQLREVLAVNHELLHVPSGGGDEVIVGEYRFDSQGVFEQMLAKRLNVKTGRATGLSGGIPAEVKHWMFNAAGEPKLLVARPRGRVAYHWRDTPGGPWRQLGEFDAFKPDYSPRYIDSTGQLFVTVNTGKDDVAQLHRFNFTTGKPEPEPLVSTPGFDFSGSVISETKGGRALGVRVVTDAESTVWFDKRMAALQQEADKRWPSTVNRLDCRRCDEPDATVVMRSFSDRDPGQIWVHRMGDNSWRKVGDVRSAIDPRRMATTDMTRIKARDGLEFPVWITTPVASATGAKSHCLRWCWCTVGPGCAVIRGGGTPTPSFWPHAAMWSSSLSFGAARVMATSSTAPAGANGGKPCKTTWPTLWPGPWRKAMLTKTGCALQAPATAATPP
jgi:hypothetical protein